MTQSFHAAFENATKIVVYYCPVIKFSDKVIGDDEFQLLATKGGVLPFTYAPNADGMLGTLEFACLDLVPKKLRNDFSDKFFSDQWVKTAANLFPSFWCKSFEEVRQTNNDEQRPSLAWYNDGIPFVSFASDIVGNASSSASKLSRLLNDCQQPDLRLGIFQPRSDRSDWTWELEVSVCHTYEKEYLDDEIGGLEGFNECLAEFQKSMYQDSNLVIVYQDKDDPSIWLHRHRDTKVYSPLPPPVFWRLKTTTKSPWTTQLSKLLDLLRVRRKKPGIHEVDEGVEVDLNENGTVGATFTVNGAEGECLEIMIGGPGRFLFRPFFPPSIWEKDGLTENILLECEKTDDGIRSVLYSEFDEDVNQPQCLCGRRYPTHNGEGIPVDLNVTNMRQASVTGSKVAEAWIRVEYKNGTHGASWDWRMVSSPHFYFCDDPNSLCQGSQYDEKENDEARRRAEEKFEELINSFFTCNEP